MLFLVLLLLAGCESVEEMQKKVENNTPNNESQKNNLNPPPPSTQPFQSSDEEILQPEIQEVQIATPPKNETNTTPQITPEVTQTPTFVPQRQQNTCANLQKILCNQQKECEFTRDLSTGKQYCRQRCKLYPLEECTGAGGCVVKQDRRNNSVCLTNCIAFENADLCDMHGDCGWSEGNCTSLGYK